MRVELAGVRNADDHAELLLHVGLGGGRLHAAEFERRAFVLVEIGQDGRGLHRLRRELQRRAGAHHAGRLRQPARRPASPACWRRRCRRARGRDSAAPPRRRWSRPTGSPRADRRSSPLRDETLELRSSPACRASTVRPSHPPSSSAQACMTPERIAAPAFSRVSAFFGLALSSSSRALIERGVTMKKLSLAVALRDLGADQRRRRPRLSEPPGHLHRALRRRRPGRHDGARAERADARLARPADRHRERHRRQRHHRRRPRGARRAGRLHGEHRQLAVAHHQRRDLQPELRHPEGPRAGRPPAAESLHRRGAQGLPGEGLQGVDRLAQGQSRQGDRRHRRRSAPASTSAASISRRSPAPNSSSCRTSPAPPTSSATSPPATSTSPSIRPSPRCRTSRAAT